MTIVAHPYLTAMREHKIAEADYVGPSWAGWWVGHAALDAQPPPVVEVPHWQDIWNTIGGGRPWPTHRPREWHLYGSRRIAKTREAARRGAWACVTFDNRQLARGERGVFQFYAPDRAQASIAFDYAAAFVEGSDLLRNMIESRTKTELVFTNRTAMRVATANFRTARGWTAIGAHVDESAFLWDGEQSANPIGALLAAARPAMATISTAQLSSATTPRAQTGEVWSIFDRFWSHDDARTLVLRADHTFNPTLDPAMIQAELERDEAVARAEYFVDWRADIDNPLPRDVVMANVNPNRGDIPPHCGARIAWFTDAAGGSGADSYTLAGAMRNSEGKRVVVLCRERRPPFSPDEVTREFAAIIKSYGGSSVTGDRFAGEWPRERFAQAGVTYNVSARTKTEIYQNALPLLTANQLEMPDNARLVAQLCALERRVARGGRETIDHPPRGHDDLCNAVLGAVLSVGDVPRGGGEAVPISYGENPLAPTYGVY